MATGVMAFEWWGSRQYCKPRCKTLKDCPYGAAFLSMGGHQSPWMPMLLLLGGDIELNLGPPVYTCCICNRKITKRHKSVQCNCTSYKHWLHVRCSDILLRNYSQSYLCLSNLNLDPDYSHSPTSSSTETASPLPSPSPPSTPNTPTSHTSPTHPNSSVSYSSSTNPSNRLRFTY